MEATPPAQPWFAGFLSDLASRLTEDLGIP